MDSWDVDSIATRARPWHARGDSRKIVDHAGVTVDHLVFGVQLQSEFQPVSAMCYFPAAAFPLKRVIIH